MTLESDGWLVSSGVVASGGGHSVMAVARSFLMRESSR